MASISSIREAHLLYDIHTVLGLPASRRWTICPLPQHIHSSNTASFSIFTSPDGVQRFKCHGNCGLQGDVIDLVGYLNVPNYSPGNIDHLMQAISLLGAEFEIRPPRQERRRAIKPAEWRRFIPPGEAVVEYAASRGLTKETLDKFHVGQFKHFMSIPAFEGGVLRGIKFRSTWPVEKADGHDFDSLRFWAAKGSVKALFNYDRVAYTEEPVLVLKGEIPVMLCDQEGFLACAPTGGEGSYIEQWKPLLAFSRKVVVVGDNDPDPEVNAKMVAKARYRAKLLQAELRFPPANHKDLDEWMLADPRAVEAIRSWLR
jgi:hypothetical protein